MSDDDHVMTMEEICEEATGLWHEWRINNQYANELAVEVGRLWDRVHKESGGGGSISLRDVATVPDSHPAHRVLYNTHPSQHRTYGETLALLQRVRQYAALTSGEWPTFTADGERAALVAAWTDLLMEAEEVERCLSALSATGSKVHSLLWSAEFVPRTGDEESRHRPAEELIGWYIRINTSRRHEYGWVVGGKGKILHIRSDPMFHYNNFGLSYSASRPVEPSRPLAASEHAAYVRDEWDTVPVPSLRFDMTKSTIYMLLPPDLAEEREDWVRGMFAKARASAEAGSDLYTGYMSWAAEASEAIRKRNAREEFLKSLPETDAREFYLKLMRQTRFAGSGSAELLRSFLEASDLSSNDIRTVILKQWEKERPNMALTADEEALLAKGPARVGSVREGVGRIMVANYPAESLTPMF